MNLDTIHNPILFREVVRKLDGRGFAAMRNHQRAVEISAATVGKLPATPPVPRSHALVPMVAPETDPPTDTFDDYGRDMCDGFAFKY